MKITQNILAAICIASLFSCSPTIYETYAKYENDTHFQNQISVSGGLLQNLNRLFNMSSESSENVVTNLLNNTESLDIVTYTKHTDSNFERDLKRSLRSIKYREVFKLNIEGNDLQFYGRGNRQRVKEFHVINNGKSQITIQSIKGTFDTNELEKLYQEAKSKDFFQKLQLLQKKD